ncbi:MAG: PadR family transcriptional regulator [Chloroflexi bacterium]|nr:PadR family transcriptional regulator [Chloroflexota bacterium]
MPRQSPTIRLTLGEWAVLGLLGCGPLHAFAIVKSLAPDGELGRVWSVPTPVVYRAVNRLRDEGLVEAIGEERSDAGPPRTLLAITPVGRRQLQAWLRSPVVHLREVRSALMLKLALLARLRKPAEPLVTAQLWTFVPIMRGLEARVAAADSEGEGSFEATLARWRLENGRAIMRFLEELQKPAQR